MMYMFTVCKCIKDDNNSEGEKERQRNVSTKCERRSKDAHIQDRKKNLSMRVMQGFRASSETISKKLSVW